MTFFGHRIGSADKIVAGEQLPAEFEVLFFLAGRLGVDDPDIALFKFAQKTDLIQSDGTANADGRTVRDFGQHFLGSRFGIGLK